MADSLFLTLTALCFCLQHIHAFPFLQPRFDASAAASSSASASLTASSTVPGWSPSQLVDVTGSHSYQDPQPGQARGPCPAQNALANHGYLDRSGCTSLLSCVAANTLVFNMGDDLATYLCFQGQLLGGDLVGETFSIGNSSAFDSTITAECPSSGGLLDLLDDGICYISSLFDSALGTEGFGMAQTHNSFEGDSSMMTVDWSTSNGFDASCRDMAAVNNFTQRMLPDGTFDNPDIIIDWASYRKKYSIATNPCYMRVPQATLFASLGAYTFMPVLFGNHTPERPDGTLTGEVLASWFSFANTSSGLLEGKGLGKEQIPNNWYKRATPLTIPEWLAVYYTPFFMRDPTLASIGGNTNGINTFTGIDIGNLTGGVINGENLLQGDNFACFLFRVLQIDLENKLPSPVGGDLLEFAADLGGVLTAIFDKMIRGSGGAGGCPTFNYTDIHSYADYCGVRQQPGGIF